SEVVQHDGCRAPEGDEAQQRGGGNQDTRNSITQAPRCSRVLGRAAHYLEGRLTCDCYARTFSKSSLAVEAQGGGCIPGFRVCQELQPAWPTGELFGRLLGILIGRTAVFYRGAARGKCLAYRAADCEKTGTRVVAVAEEGHGPIQSSGETACAVATVVPSFLLCCSPASKRRVAKAAPPISSRSRPLLSRTASSEPPM